MFQGIQIVDGLNWGCRMGKNPNQAYIPIPEAIAKSDFFPPIGIPFAVLADDNFPFIGIKTPPKKKEGKNEYAVESTNNSEIGEYFRRKLGLPLGTFVTLENLDRYGTRYVTFTKVTNDEYYMNFHPHQNATSAHLKDESSHFFCVYSRPVCIPFVAKKIS